MSIDAARSAGVDVADAGLAHRIASPFAKLLGLARDDEDEDASSPATASNTPATAPAVPLRARAKAAVVAAIEHAEDKLAAEKSKLAQVASHAEDKLAAEKTKLIAVASKAHVISRAEAAPLAALTPSQIILARGYWQGLPDGMTAGRPAQASANPLADLPRPLRTDVASADSDSTSSLGPSSAAPEDRVPNEPALAYAEPAGREAPAHVAPTAATGVATPRAAVNHAVAVQTGDSAMTIAVKRVDGRPASAILTVAKQKLAPLAEGAPVNDPWLRAVVLSPSVNRFLCITALGPRDFGFLAELMVKPANSVTMTFAGDPNTGLAHDHFSGSAIVFVSTVSYPMHTAELQ